MKRSPLLTIFFIVFFDLVAFGIVIPILPYYSKSFGANAFALGWLMASYSIAQFIFSPLWGSLSDRVGRRPVLLFTMLGGACAMLASALAGSFWILLAARIFAGIFGANISTASAYIADVTTEENRAKGMGIIGAGFGLGFIFGPAIGGILSQHGYATPILFAAAIGLCNFIFAFFVLEESREPTPTQKKWSLNNARTAFSRPATAAPIFLFFLSTLAFTQVEVIFALFVLEKFSFEAHQAGWILAGMGVVGALIQGGLIGRLSKRFGEKKLVHIGFFLLCFSLLIAAFAPTPITFILALLIVATGNALVVPSLSSLVSKGALQNQKGAVMGIYQSASSLARIFGPPIAGIAFDQIYPNSPILLSAFLMAIALLASFTWGRKMA